MKTMRMGRGGGLLLAGLAAVAALGAGWVRAETRIWTGAVDDDWFVAGNWDPSDSVPQADDTVLITSGAPILASSTPALAALTITNATLTATNWTTAIQAATVTLRAGGVITCSGPFGNAPEMTNRVHIVCTDLTIDAGGKIDVSGAGFRGSTASQTVAGPGAGSGSQWHCGAGGHGGRGGLDSYAGAQYGDSVAPWQPGSGGAYCPSAVGSYGTAGGGAVWVEAQGDVSVNGAILANGANVTHTTHPLGRGSSGAGGSIYIRCRRLLGDGVLRANGGQQNHDYSTMGSGAGGRIAIHNDPAEQGGSGSSSVSFSAMGGYKQYYYTGDQRGKMGSIHLVDPDLVAVTFDNIAGRLEGPLPFTGASVSITDDNWLGFGAGARVTLEGDVWVTSARARFVIGGARELSDFWRYDLAGTGTVVHITGDLTVTNGAQFKVYSGGTNNLTASGASTLVKVDGTLGLKSTAAVIVGSHHLLGYAPEFQVGRLDLIRNGSITAAHRGWRGATGSTGAAGSSSHDRWGWGEGAGRKRQGAGHGGIGYDYLGDPARGGNTYGSSNAPALPGSGGGSGYDTYGGGGHGGGLVRVIAGDAITLGSNAVITVAGQDGIDASSYLAQRIGGGGSGGGINLRARRFHADLDVKLLVPGGKGGRTGYGGGGGRIAVWRMTDTSPVELTTVVGGGVGRDGGADKPEWSGGEGSVVLGWLPLPGTLILVR